MDDAAIVALFWARDERAIPATAEKYGSYCTAVARNILRDQRDAEECVS
ncbi:MAG TPA: RNA polymerase subunit sigma-70, partial [Oscillibacter sp.]|nr:RNA polymerase subunit sigma-70 [Oscillibacter sp.]